jgi:hypothetical protein
MIGGFGNERVLVEVLQVKRKNILFSKNKPIPLQKN